MIIGSRWPEEREYKRLLSSSLGLNWFEDWYEVVVDRLKHAQLGHERLGTLRKPLGQRARPQFVHQLPLVELNRALIHCFALQQACSNSGSEAGGLDRRSWWRRRSHPGWGKVWGLALGENGLRLGFTRAVILRGKERSPGGEQAQAVHWRWTRQTGKSGMGCCAWSSIVTGRSASGAIPAR